MTRAGATLAPSTAVAPAVGASIELALRMIAPNSSGSVSRPSALMVSWNC